MSLPILYSLRRCPYAMRARMGLLLAKQPVMLRDIVTRNKPYELLAASPKGTVPVIVLNNSQVIDQSLDIMLWALNLNDPQNLLRNNLPNIADDILMLVRKNDSQFIPLLEQYRASARYHNDDLEQRRQDCEVLIAPLEARLSNHSYLFGDSPSLADYALMPFISQFARVEKKWFVQSEYKNIAKWLKSHYESTLYTKVMKQYPQWIESQEEFLFE
ncbi:glutathione S-transferase [Photobacterium makurazakiensis]|uniref:glutathione S-transferase n=1 Tax=Photobacterium makurazakiensis TaxID=2910234 RepID=UPI003D10ABEC